MAFPLLTTGLINSVTFGCYSNALDYLTQSRRSGRSQGEPASAAQVFAAGCFSGLMQVRLQRLRFAVCYLRTERSSQLTWIHREPRNFFSMSEKKKQ